MKRREFLSRDEQPVVHDLGDGIRCVWTGGHQATLIDDSNGSFIALEYDGKRWTVVATE